MIRLRRWGLLDKVVATNCPEIPGLGLDLGEIALKGVPPPIDGVASFYAPRRTGLDKILVDAAVEAGAELRTGFSVREIVMDNGRVTGVRGDGKSKASTETLSGRIVVGADGMRSAVARSVQAPEYNGRPSLTCWYYSYWSGLPVQEATWHVRGDKLIGVVSTNDGLSVVITVWKNDRFHDYRTNIEQNFLQTLDLVPALARRLKDGKRQERFVGTGDLPNFFRKPYGPGWVLVGDAGYHKDPVTGQGITDAFCDAELVTQAIDEGFSGRRPLDAALADYERQRNERVMPMYEFTCQLASLDPPPPEMLQLYAALSRNQEETNCFMGAIAGTVPIPEFFAPDNVARIVAAA